MVTKEAIPGLLHIGHNLFDVGLGNEPTIFISEEGQS